VILEIVSLDKEQITSHRRSTTFSSVAKTSLRKPRFRISFQICSIGFISGVYGGMWKRTIFSGNSSFADLCHTAPSQQSSMTSSAHCLTALSKIYSCKQNCNRAKQESIHLQSTVLPLHRHNDTHGYGDKVHWDGYLSHTNSISVY